MKTAGTGGPHRPPSSPITIKKLFSAAILEIPFQVHHEKEDWSLSLFQEKKMIAVNHLIVLSSHSSLVYAMVNFDCQLDKIEK